MNIRRFFNTHPLVIGVLAVLLAVVPLWFSYSRSFGRPSSTVKYFTVDDGKTYFAGKPLDFAPFMKDGKEAVLARVFECDGDAFVGYLERFNKEARPVMDDLIAANKEKRPPRDSGAIMNAARFGIEIKRRGDKDWVPASPGGRPNEMTMINCKDGTTALTVH